MAKKYFVEIDVDRELILLDKKEAFKISVIEGIGYLSDVIVHSGDGEFSDKDRSSFLVIRGKSPLKQYGRFTLSKSRNVYIPTSNTDAEINSLFEQYHTLSGESKQTPALDISTFSFDSATAEAKRGMNDYTRGATLGTHAYGKAGIINPVLILTLLNVAENPTFHISYQGTTSKGHTSAWFKANPEIDFYPKDCDFFRYRLHIGMKELTASCDFERRYIESDENATGIWQVHIEKGFSDICEAAKWLKFCQDLSSISPIDESQSQSDTKIKYSKDELLNMLTLLHEAGILSDPELEIKSKLLR